MEIGARRRKFGLGDMHRARVRSSDMAIKFVLFGILGFPATAKRHVVVGAVGLGCASFLHDLGHIGVCWLGFLVAGQPWCVDDLRNGCICVARHTGRICFGTDLQELWRHQMEE